MCLDFLCAHAYGVFPNVFLSFVLRNLGSHLLYHLFLFATDIFFFIKKCHPNL